MIFGQEVPICLLQTQLLYYLPVEHNHGSGSSDMSRLSAKRPSSLALRQRYSDAFVNVGGQGNKPFPFTWFDLVPNFSWKRVLPYRRLRKSQFVRFALVLLVLIVLTVHNLPRIRLKLYSNMCSYGSSFSIYEKGRRVCYTEQLHDSKYLTYQPPGGGWNNQRIAFENAVIIAKLLKRILIVHPMAPHQEILRIKELYHHFNLSHEVYNSVPSENLLPLSEVIDLNRLSKLLPVKEILTNHTKFLEDNKHFSWYRVCHNGLQGLWVDSLPSSENLKAWNALRQRANDMQLRTLRNIPAYRRSCKDDMALYSNTTEIPIWGILDELSQRTENIIYFEEGSMFFRQMIFLSKKRTLDAHKWLIKFITFATPIWKRLQNFHGRIGVRYNAIHIRRTDHPTSHHLSPEDWLHLLNKRGAFNITSNLYVATDEKNLTWFIPFRKVGYHLMFSKDFMEEFTRNNNKTSDHLQDIIGMTEQLICAHAQLFVGSYYSTFSLFIKRLRKHLFWRGQLLAYPHFPVTWLDGIG